MNIDTLVPPGTCDTTLEWHAGAQPGAPRPSVPTAFRVHASRAPRANAMGASIGTTAYVIPLTDIRSVHPAPLTVVSSRAHFAH